MFSRMLLTNFTDILVLFGIFFRGFTLFFSIDPGLSGDPRNRLGFGIEIEPNHHVL